MHKASTFLLQSAARRTFTSYATQVHSSGLNFTRSDISEYPELNRSFMKVLDSGVDTQSADY